MFYWLLRNFRFRQRPKNGIVLLGFGTHRNRNEALGCRIQASSRFWTFNERLKLQDVQVEEMPQEGSFDLRKVPANSPKIRIDLSQSDEAIRRQLLVYMPRGQPAKNYFCVPE